MAIEPALFHFENILDLVGLGGDGGFVERLHLERFEDGSFGIDVGAGEWDERVAHVEGDLVRLREDEDHAFQFGDVGAEHHAGLDLLVGGGDFGGDLVGADPKFNGGELGLWSAFGFGDWRWWSGWSGGGGPLPCVGTVASGQKQRQRESADFREC